MCGVMSLDALLLPSERPTTFTTFHRIFAHNLPQITFRGGSHMHHGRSLATTAGKLIGLVPRLTQVDDEIFVLVGGQVLYVLRPVGECFQCIGESYIYGLMDGEALRKLEDGTAEVDTIRII